MWRKVYLIFTELLFLMGLFLHVVIKKASYIKAMKAHTKNAVGFFLREQYIQASYRISLDTCGSCLKSQHIQVEGAG
jgi:uncharacterized membrane protein YdbT with pleckstrin-like domain